MYDNGYSFIAIFTESLNYTFCLCRRYIMQKQLFFLFSISTYTLMVGSSSPQAATTFWPDWQGTGIEGANLDINRDKLLCEEEDSRYVYYPTGQCPIYT